MAEGTNPTVAEGQAGSVRSSLVQHYTKHAAPVLDCRWCCEGPTDSPVILGRALVDRRGDVWQLNQAGDLWLTDLTVDANAYTREEIERLVGEVTEVLLVSPAAGRVLEAVAEWATAYTTEASSDEDWSEVEGRYARARRTLFEAWDAMVGDRPAERMPAFVAIDLDQCPECGGPLRRDEDAQEYTCEESGHEHFRAPTEECDAETAEEVLAAFERGEKGATGRPATVQATGLTLTNQGNTGTTASVAADLTEPVLEPDEDPIPRYGQLDVWLALGGDATAFERWRDQRTYAAAWAQLMVAVRRDVHTLHEDRNPPAGEIVDLLLSAPEPVPVPDSGPGWDRAAYDQLLHELRGQHLDAYADSVEKLFDVLLADRDRLSIDVEQSQDRTALAESALGERERQLAECQAEYSSEVGRLRVELEQTSGAYIASETKLATARSHRAAPPRVTKPSPPPPPSPGDGLGTRDCWSAMARDRAAERDAARAELAEARAQRDRAQDQLRAHEETTRYHQQRHAEAYREVVRLRGELEQARRLVKEVAQDRDSAQDKVEAFPDRLATARREAAADALEEAANDANRMLGATGQRALTAADLRARAAEVRSGQRRIEAATTDQPTEEA